MRLPDASAAEGIASDGMTVAADNPAYASKVPVVVVVFERAVEAQLSSWDRRTPLAVSELEDVGRGTIRFPCRD